MRKAMRKVPRGCPFITEALGKFARLLRSLLFIVPVMRAHVRGHGCSCTRVRVPTYMSRNALRDGQKVLTLSGETADVSSRNC